MKQLILWLLVGLVSFSCSKSSPAPTLVGVWDLTSRREVTAYKDGRPPVDETTRLPQKNEYFAGGRYTFFYGTASNYTAGEGTYTHAGGVLTMTTAYGPNTQIVAELTDHRLVLTARRESSDATTDVTWTWAR